MALIKHKNWIENISRVRGDTEARHGFLRLDRNERVTPFSSDFWSKVQKEITQEAILAYPQQELLYSDLAAFHDLSKENFVITAGSDLAIRNVFELCVQPGDSVVYMSPTYAMVDVYAQLFSAECRKSGFNKDLSFDVSEFIANIDASTSLVVIANPNSPTGTILSTKEIEVVLKKAQQFDCAVLVDEAYYEFCGESSMPLISSYENLIVARTFSKACGLAGLRVGYLAANEMVANLLYKFRPMYEVSSLAVVFARTILNNYQEVESYAAAVKEGKLYLQAEMDQLGLPYLDTHTNFIHIDLGKFREDIGQELERNNILVRSSLPGERYANFIRATLGPVAEMKKVIECFKAIL